MDQGLARHVAITTIHLSTELNSLLPILKEHCEAAEYSEFLHSIASVCGHINSVILNPIFTSHPDLQQEIEASIGKYGKAI